MEVTIHFNIAMVIAVVLAEVVSMLLIVRKFPWSLICNVGLLFLIKYIMENHWSVHKWEDALFLSLWIALMYFCLVGSHAIYNANMFFYLFVHALLQKLAVSFVMCWALVYFKNYD